jgi:hypothetical protein
MKISDFANERARTPCAICDHAERKKIEKAIGEYASLPNVKRRQFGVLTFASEYVPKYVLDGERIDKKIFIRHAREHMGLSHFGMRNA